MKNPLDIIASKSPHLCWIKDRCVFLTLHGSRAYNTNVETSDWDFKGICTPPKHLLFGSNGFEQAELKEPDTVIYDLRKFFSLAANCNPSIIEVLFTDESDYIHVSDIGREILDHKYNFLSKRAKYSFGGYALSQMKRMLGHREWIRNPINVKPERKDFNLPEQTLIPQDQLVAAMAEVEKELSKFNLDFIDDLREDVKIQVVDVMTKMIAELKITSEDRWMSAARKVGLSDNFIEIMKQERRYSSAKKAYDQFQSWKTNRNKDRYEMEEKFGYDGKHMLHLTRLYRMAIEIIAEGKVVVKRPDRDYLLEIRNGKIPFDNLMEEVAKMQKKLEDVYINSNVLPKSPNTAKIEELQIRLMEKSLEK